MAKNYVSLKECSTFGVDAKARHFFRVTSEYDLPEFIDYIKSYVDTINSYDHDITNEDDMYEYVMYILGEGSNTLFPDEVGDVIIKNDIDWINAEENYFADEPDAVLVKAGSGTKFEELLDFCLENGYYGLENLVGIPGSVGAAAVGNIGAYGVQQSDCFYSIEGYDLYNDGFSVGCVDEEDEMFKSETYNGKAEIHCEFKYRGSSLQQWYITEVGYKLSKVFVPKLNYQGLDELPKDITAEQLVRHIRHIRNSKIPDYKKLGNAGSFFKNPIVTIAEFTVALAKCGMLKCYPAKKDEIYNPEQEDLVKLSAAQLIELSGLKGYREGNCGVSEQHSLILVNYGGATGNEISSLAYHVAKKVEGFCGIYLESEVHYLNEYVAPEKEDEEYDADDDFEYTEARHLRNRDMIHRAVSGL